MSQTDVQINGISIKSILENLQKTDLTGIYITSVKKELTDTFSYFIVDKDFVYNTEIDPSTISDISGQYFDKTYSNEDLYLVIADSNATILSTTTQSFTFKLPASSNSLTNSNIYPLTAGEETYEVPVIPNSTPTLQQESGESTVDIPPALSTYPIARVEKAFNNYDSDKIIDRRAYETLTADIEAKMTANGGIMPQFKSFADYTAYKNSLSARNYVANNP